MDNPARPLLLLVWCLLLVGTAAEGDTLEVGPGKQFARIEDANGAARAGDVVLVYPLDGNRPYEKTAAYVRQPGLTFRAVSGEGNAGG